LKSAAVAAAIGVIAAAGLRDYHPFPRFGPANTVTSLRALLVAAAAGLIGEPHTTTVAWIAVWLGLGATLLDGADGWLARRTAMMSPFGARFDMEVDALLILALSVLAWRFEKAGAWVIASGAMRYAFIAAGLRWRWLQAPLPPSLRRKIVCVVQLSALTLILFPAVAPPFSTAIAATALAILTCSFLVDTLWLWRRAA
jgi:phosphatidylglycerophosphate synthase